MVTQMIEAQHRHHLAPWVALVAILLSLLLPPAVPILLIAGAVAFIYAHQYDEARRAVVAFYGVEDDLAVAYGGWSPAGDRPDLAVREQEGRTVPPLQEQPHPRHHPERVRHLHQARRPALRLADLSRRRDPGDGPSTADSGRRPRPYTDRGDRLTGRPDGAAAPQIQGLRQEVCTASTAHTA
jgi:hypothetical protein